MSLKRAELCLNYVTSDPSTIGAVCPETGRHMFTVGGTVGEEVLETLLDLRDDQGKPAVTVVKRYEPGRRDGKLAEARVELPNPELAYACAHCGRWENEHQGVKFKRCSGCKVRYYCIPLCQKEDWTSKYHKGDCELLRQGKAHEVEMRRKLHGNDWFHHSPLARDNKYVNPGQQNFFDKTLAREDWVLMAHGVYAPPRDVPDSAVKKFNFDQHSLGFDEKLRMQMLQNFCEREEVLAHKEITRRLRKYPAPRSPAN
ncbi:hypothetical protein C8T65DRAFT_236228 [Cerioporus squamosus]|nr:hypothetical protein C8T65DRAFT_236228 [Cerioporus squamosus]